MTRPDAYESVTDCRSLICSGTLRYQEAEALFRRFYSSYPRTDIRLLEYARDNAPESLLLVVRILAAVSDGSRLTSTLMSVYTGTSERRLRAQLAGLIARSFRNHTWVTEALSDPDPRVRANVIEGIRVWSDDFELPLRALYDVHHRVVCAACISLVKLGHPAGHSTLKLMLQDTRWQFRVAACWSFGEIGTSDDLDLLTPMQEDPHPFVRSHARRAIERIEAGPRLEPDTPPGIDDVAAPPRLRLV